VIFQIVVIIAAVILGLYWLSPTTGNGETDPLDSPGGIPFPVLWEQKLRQIASEEVQNAFAEQSDSIEDAERGRQRRRPPHVLRSYGVKKNSRRYTPKLLQWCARGPRRCGKTQRP